jgi:hypothetical protein
MLVEGEYRLSIKDLRIRGETTLGASDKIHAALFLVEPLPQALGGANDGPVVSFMEALLVAGVVPLPAPIMHGEEHASLMTPSGGTLTTNFIQHVDIGPQLPYAPTRQLSGCSPSAFITMKTCLRGKN